MLLEFVFIRHGHTPVADESPPRYIGRTDIGLDDIGRKQARETAALLKNEHFDMVYVSPLKRAVETARIILAEAGIPARVQPDDRLTERSFGIWENLSYEEIGRKYPKLCKEWTEDWICFQMPGGESAAHVYNRVKSFIDELCSGAVSGKILIVTHKGVITNALAILLNLRIDDIWRFQVKYGGVARVEVTDGYGVLTQLG